MDCGFESHVERQLHTYGTAAAKGPHNARSSRCPPSTTWRAMAQEPTCSCESPTEGAVRCLNCWMPNAKKRSLRRMEEREQNPGKAYMDDYKRGVEEL